MSSEYNHIFCSNTGCSNIVGMKNEPDGFVYCSKDCIHQSPPPEIDGNKNQRVNYMRFHPYCPKNCYCKEDN